MIDEKLLSFSEIPEGSLAAVAARKHGCTLDDLLKWREDEDGTVVIILATGQKYTYSAIEMLGAVVGDMFGASGSELPGGGCAGTGSVVRTAEEVMTVGLEPGASDVTKSKEGVTPIAGDSQTPDPAPGHGTKAEELVSPAPAAAAALVAKSPERKKSTSTASGRRQRTKNSEPEK